MPREYQRFELDRQAVRQFMVEGKSFWIATPPKGAREDDCTKHPPLVFARSFAPKQSRIIYDIYFF
ncbi:MAG TPA: hypothetical protein VMW10_05720 [Alphaproteobacteria bacterium]|nr:hypothetical protein [Alphaproteobacteria bacterium]